MTAKMDRKAIARAIVLTGPLSMSAVNMATAFLLSTVSSPKQFGLFSFAIALSQLTIGLANALVVTPLTAASSGRRLVPVETFTFISLILALSAGLVIACVVDIVSGDLALSASAFSLTTLQAVRWTARGYLFSVKDNIRPVLSDLCFSLATATGVGVLAMQEKLTSYSALMVLALANLAALTVISPRLARALGLKIGHLAEYRTVWRKQAKWSLIGVVVTEMTANAHTYIITALAGPAALAPIALASLVWRPLSVCVSALTPSERASMAREIEDHQRNVFPKTFYHFTAVLLFVVALNAAAITILLTLTNLIGPSLRRETLILSVVTTGIMIVIRSIREPLGVLFQAHGLFKELSILGLVTAVVSLSFVALVVTFTSAAYSLLAIGFSELVLCALIIRRLRKKKYAIAA